MLVSIPTLIAPVAMAMAAPSWASPGSSIYRCPPPAGSSSQAVYTDQPCPQGEALQAQDQRSAAQRKAAQARAREEAQWTESMARQRRQEERALAANQQRQASVIGREKVEISTPARDSVREAELKRMSRPPRGAAKPAATEPPPAGGGNAPKATPGRP